MDFLAYLKKIRPDLELSEQPYDEVAFARLRAESVNKSPGTLTGYDCPKCQNRGYFLRVEPDGHTYSQECECMNTRRCIRQMERSGLGWEVLKKSTFSKFQTDHPWQEAAKATARRYAEDPKGWFLACGQSGSGKTHLCTAICIVLLNRQETVKYFSWRNESARLKNPETRQALVEEMLSASTLYLDDLFKMGAGPDGKVRPTASDISIAYEILNSRYQREKRTILSTELLPQELLDIDEALAGRILEMVGQNCIQIAPDIRKNHRIQALVG